MASPLQPSVVEVALVESSVAQVNEVPVGLEELLVPVVLLVPVELVVHVELVVDGAVVVERPVSTVKEFKIHESQRENDAEKRV